MKKILLLCSTACVLPTAAFAQSTGTEDFENTIIITGTRAQDVAGIQVPDAPKAKAVVTQEMIARSSPGQNVLDALNVVPGLSFQNNDAYGNAGGTLTIRGFDSTRISYTLDGIQLNDSGNYNIYSNFSIDPELIEQVNVSLGSTDVDSPTASAVGGTINQRTRNPGKEFGGRFLGTVGDYDYRRLFGMIDTGEITPWGTRAFIAGSISKYDNPYNNYGKMNRKQVNAKIFQPIGSNGDFISVAGRYNRDRNNFFGSVTLRDDRPVPDGFPQSRSDREYDLANFPCQTDVPQAGVRDTATSCGSEFDRRYNPSNSVNIRGNSKFSLTPRLTLTVDPSYQYTKANGGGTVIARESFRRINGVDYTGFIGGQYYFGVDLNGDGDTLDTCSTTGGSCSSSNLNGVRLLAPSQTRTRRFAAIVGLSYDINDYHAVRFAYTYDRSDHRQTGELAPLEADGEPTDVFAIDNALTDFYGNLVEKRDRQSYAVLNKVAAEYRGEFGPLTAIVGASLPFFKRDLQNNCFTTSANGFVDCFGGNQTLNDAYQTLNPTFQGPQKRVLKYSKLLPNIGVIYDLTPQISAFASYAKNISVPSTDNLYNAFFFPADEDRAKPNPETTDTFDGGLRYRSSRIQAQLSGWFTRFNDRLASAYDPELDRTVYRNLGRVDKYGIDGSIAYEFSKAFTLYAFGSVNESKIKDNIQIGGTNFDCDTASADATGLRNCAFTAGKHESGAPRYQYGASAVTTIGPFNIGATAKRTGPRYVYDTNFATFDGDVDNLGTATAPVQIYSAKAPAYWLVNLDTRMNLGYFSTELDKTYLQLNVYNLFDKLYVGGFGGGLSQGVSASSGFYSGPGFVQIGAPRTVSLSVNVGF